MIESYDLPDNIFRQIAFNNLPIDCILDKRLLRILQDPDNPKDVRNFEYSVRWKVPPAPRKLVSAPCQAASSCGHADPVRHCRACWLRQQNPTNPTSWGIFCKHGTQKSRCLICKGAGVCQHQRLEFQCLICNRGSRICIHKTFRDRCLFCKNDAELKEGTGDAQAHHNSSLSPPRGVAGTPSHSRGDFLCILCMLCILTFSRPRHPQDALTTSR